jgi:hypothetical protein
MLPDQLQYQNLTFLALDDLLNPQWVDAAADLAQARAAGASFELYGKRIQLGVLDSLVHKDTFAAAAKSFPKATAVSLRNPVLLRDYAANFQALADFPHIEEVYLEQCRLADSDLRPLGQLKKLKRLTLRFSGDLTGAGIAHLAGLENLETLRIEYQNKLGDDALATIAALPKLKVLELRDCFALTAAGVAKLARLKNLEELHLTGRGRVDGKVLKQLAGLERLRVLELYQFGLLDADVDDLIKFTNLETLLWHDEGRPDGKLTEAGVARLAALKHLKTFHFPTAPTRLTARALDGLDLGQFRSLDLRGIHLKNDDMKSLEPATRLQCLYLPYGELSDAALEPLPKLKALTEVHVPFSLFSDARLETLRGAMPGTLVVRWR